MRLYLTEVLICILLMISIVEHLSIYLFDTGMFSLEKCLFKLFAHFLIVICRWWFFIFYFLLLSYMSSLYILDINLLLDIRFTNIFSRSVGCLFILLIVCFTVKKKFLSSMENSVNKKGNRKKLKLTFI